MARSIPGAEITEACGSRRRGEPVGAEPVLVPQPPLSLADGRRPLDPLLDQLLPALGEGVYGIDAEGRAAFLNPAACALLGGYAAEELLGARRHDLIHPLRPDGTPCPESECAIYAVLRDGQERRVTGEHFRRRDGSTFPVEYTATPVREGERVVGAVVVFRDVTARVEAENALRQAYAQQQALLDNLADPAWMKDSDLRYVAVNEAVLRTTGLPRDAFIGRTSRGRLSPAEADRDEADDRRALAGETVTAEEMLPWRSRPGSPTWIEIVRRRIEGPDGVPTGMVGIARDITGRKRREEADRFLAEASQVIIASLAWTETLRSIATLVVPRMGDWCVVSLFSPQGGVEQVEVRAVDLEWEDRLRRFVARRPDAYGLGNDLVGRSVLNGQGEILLDLSPAELESLAGHPREAEPSSARKPGSALVVPLIAESRATGVLLLARETGRAAFDTRDLLLIQELGHWAALAIEHARQHRLANEAVHARDEVLRVVAHDLRGLVTSVSLSAQVLELVRLEERNGRAVHSILQAAGRMDRLIQDLLDVSRVEGGQLPLEPASLDPAAVLREALEASDALARDRGVRLIIEAADPLPPVRADANRVLQVLANLLGNAIQFTPPGEEVRVNAKRLGHQVVFSVKDTGPGIPPDELPHVFDRFWRARGAPARGTGLGLPIARGIVGAHGGRIWATSEVGHGSQFCFTLPLVDAPGPEDGAPAGKGVCRSAPADPPTTRGAAPVRILIVDDHQALRDGVRAILRREGDMEVVDEAARGEEAIRKTQLLDPDVVVVDLSLPGMDGFETIRRIGALGRGVRVLVLTAHAPEKSLIKAMEAGASGFVRKATAHQDLVPALRTVLKGEVFLDSHSNHVLVRSLERALEARRRLYTLSDHEREIVRLTAEGYTAQEIAERIFLSHHTVASYRSQAMRKLGLEHRSDLVRFALETELIAAE